MYRSLESGGSATLSVTDKCQGPGGDKITVRLSTRHKRLKSCCGAGMPGCCGAGIVRVGAASVRNLRPVLKRRGAKNIHEPVSITFAVIGHADAVTEHHFGALPSGKYQH